MGYEFEPVVKNAYPLTEIKLVRATQMDAITSIFARTPVNFERIITEVAVISGQQKHPLRLKSNFRYGLFLELHMSHVLENLAQDDPNINNSPIPETGLWSHGFHFECSSLPRQHVLVSRDTTQQYAEYDQVITIPDTSGVPVPFVFEAKVNVNHGNRSHMYGIHKKKLLQLIDSKTRMARLAPLATLFKTNQVGFVLVTTADKRGESKNLSLFRQVGGAIATIPYTKDEFYAYAIAAYHHS